MRILVTYTLRFAVAILFLASVLAGANSLVFPGVGIILVGIGLSWFLWDMCGLLSAKSPDEKSDLRKGEYFNTKFRRVIPLVVAGVLLAQFGRVLFNI